MTDAPKRIWAEPPDIFDGMGFWRDASFPTGSPYILAALSALAEAPEVQALIAEAVEKATRVKPLVWESDGRRLRLDETMTFSKSYDWDGYECFRQEGYGLGCGYIIWPSNIGSADWNLYGTRDGLFVTDLRGEEAAKAAAQADYEQRIRAAIEPPSGGFAEQNGGD